VVAHGTLYHGTREPLSAFQPGETYMTSSPENAAGYAAGGHLGGSGDGPPQVLSVATTPGRTLDINQAIMDEVFSNDGDFGDAINAQIAKARPAGYRYLTYEHPSFDGGADHPVVISLHPHEDLAMSGLAGDSAAATEAPSAAAVASVPEPVPGIRAYHGSPAAFDRFSNDYIGTGEGAQAYGVGHYAAENEGIARSYRDALSQRSMSDPEDRAAYAAASDKGIAAIRGIANLQGRMTQESMAAPAYRPSRIEADGTPVVNTDIHPEVAAKYQPQMDALVAARDAAKADADAVAIKYNPAVGGQLYDSDNPIHRTAYYLDRNGGDVGRTLSAIDDELAMVDRNRQGWDNTKPYDDAAGRLSEMKQILQTDAGSVPPYKTPGHMYELNLRVDLERMLAWDKPRDQLAPAVREFAEANYPDAWAKAADGSSLYERMAREADRANLGQRMARSDAWGYLSASDHDPEAALSLADKHVDLLQRTVADFKERGATFDAFEYDQALKRARATSALLKDPELLSEEPLSGEALVSRQLHEAGVPGIRYLDASSRSGGKETHNHVIFDPENIEIVRRYGLAGLLAGGGAVAASGAGGQQ
jgi:hypothetical protein